MRHDPGELHPVGQGHGHGHQGEDGERQGHDAHQDAAHAQVHAAAALAGARHDGGEKPAGTIGAHTKKLQIVRRS